MWRTASFDCQRPKIKNIVDPKKYPPSYKPYKN